MNADMCCCCQAAFEILCLTHSTCTGITSTFWLRACSNAIRAWRTSSSSWIRERSRLACSPSRRTRSLFQLAATPWSEWSPITQVLDQPVAMLAKHLLFFAIFLLVTFFNISGFWMFHCHFLYHLVTGMSVVLQVGEVSDMTSTPKGFPTCGDFF